MRGAGGSDGGIGRFFIGLIMMVAGGYLFLDAISVTHGFGLGRSLYSFGSFHLTSGMVLVPLIFGIGFIFYNASNPIGWILSIASLVMLGFGIISSIGVAGGVLIANLAGGFNVDLFSYLFGNILMISVQDLYLILGLDVVVVLVGLLCYNPLLAVCFDEEYARLRGIRVEFFYLLLLCLTALTVVLLISVVGIVLVIALLTLPAAVASHFSRTLWQMMGLATLCSAAFTTLGLALSYSPNLPAGATIIVLAGGTYLAVSAGSVLPRFRR